MVTMETYRPPRRTSYLALLLIVGGLCALAFTIIAELKDSAQLYSDAQHELAKPVYSGKLAEVKFPDVEKPLFITTWKVFRPGELWSLVNKANALPDNFEPQGLTDTTVPHGDSSEPMKIHSRIAEPLAELFAAAEADGYNLMLSSAYRSIEEQQSLYDRFVAARGQAEAERFVLTPGTSEHHTGLAVDFSDASSACSLDSDTCLLSLETGNWLAANAHHFGFILRYPEGKQPITGIDHESWHFRYVGPILARAIYDSGLTLDEALTQMRPAYASQAD